MNLTRNSCSSGQVNHYFESVLLLRNTVLFAIVLQLLVAWPGGIFQVLLYIINILLCLDTVLSCISAKIIL